MAPKSSQGLNYIFQLTLMKMRGTGGLDTVFILFVCSSTMQATLNKDNVVQTQILLRFVKHYVIY